MPRISFAPEAGLLAVVLIWGLNFAVIKVPLEVAPPFTVNLLRFVVSAAVLGAIHVGGARAKGVSPLATFDVGPVSVVAIGLLGILAYQAVFILGIDRVSAGTGALLIATSPVWTAVTAHALGHERLLALGWIGMLTSLVGVALVIEGNPGAALEGDGTGVLLMLASALAWGLYTALSRPLLQRGATAPGLTFWGIVISAPGLFFLALPELPTTNWAAFGLPEVAAILFSGGLSTGLAYAIWNQSVLSVGASRTAAFSNLVPVVGVLAGIVLRGESVTGLQMAGGALIVLGVVVVRRRGIAPVRGGAPEAVPPIAPDAAGSSLGLPPDPRQR